MNNPKGFLDATKTRILALVASGTIKVPEGYNAERCLDFAIEGIMEKGNETKRDCSGNSVAIALKKMVEQGLSPYCNQCYFVPNYNKELKFKRSYFGDITVVRRLVGKNILINAEEIHEGDVLQVQDHINGMPQRITLVQPDYLDRYSKPVVGAYCCVIDENTDKVISYSCLNKEMLNACWEKSKGNVNKKFPGEMAKKTAIIRACKLLVNTIDVKDKQLLQSFTSDSSEIVSNLTSEEAENYEEEFLNV